MSDKGGTRRLSASPKVIAAAEKSARRRSVPEIQAAVGSSDYKSRSSKSKRKEKWFSSRELEIAQQREYYRVEVVRKQVFEVDVRYQNIEKIGSGAYGLVCAAQDKVSGKPVAVKKVADVFEDLVDAKRILREIKLLQHFAKHGPHDNIVKLVDVMTGPPYNKRFSDLYMVFDHHECDMDNIIKSNQELSEAHAQYFLYQILKGLKFLHSAGVIHRDLKPANLLVNSDCHLVICDFGLARGVAGIQEELAAAADAPSQMTQYVVTRYYRAPELLCNSPYDELIDIWSAGLIFAEIMTRRVVLRGNHAMDQFKKTVLLAGIPTEEECDFITDDAALRLALSLKTRPANLRLESVLSNCSDLALDLVKKMLTFHPRKRINVKQALAHEFFDAVHEELGVDEPECPVPFDGSFEKDYPLVTEMPKSLLRRHMFTAMVHFSCDLRNQEQNVENV